MGSSMPDTRLVSVAPVRNHMFDTRLGITSVALYCKLLVFVLDCKCMSPWDPQLTLCLLPKGGGGEDFNKICLLLLFFKSNTKCQLIFFHAHQTRYKVKLLYLRN